MLNINTGLPSLEQLGYMSVFAQWLSLSTAACLSIARKRLDRLPSKISIIYVILIFSVCFCLTELSFFFFSSLYIINSYTFLESVFRYLGCISIFLVALRIIKLLNTIEQRGQSHADAKLSALQARIKPHFLFNSLNTIAELTHDNKEQAEHAINALATLFRASLSTEEKEHSLEDELNLCYRYEDLERWRLDKRLNVEWHIDIQDKKSINVPKLILQPILENSISHGVEADGNINVKLDIRETNNMISMMVSNGINKHRDTRHGNGIAIDNIKERLFVMYDDHFKFKIKNQIEKYSVFIQIPKR